MPRRSIATEKVGETPPAERRVTRSSQRKSVDGGSDASSPEKPKSSPSVKASPSPSGAKRGRAKKSATPVKTGDEEKEDKTETTMDVDKNDDEEKQENKTEVKSDDVADDKLGASAEGQTAGSDNQKESLQSPSKDKKEEEAKSVEPAESKKNQKESLQSPSKDKKVEEAKSEEPAESKKRQRDEDDEELNAKKQRSDDVTEGEAEGESSKAVEAETEKKDASGDVAEQMETTSVVESASAAETVSVETEVKGPVENSENIADIAVDSGKTECSEANPAPACIENNGASEETDSKDEQPEMEVVTSSDQTTADQAPVDAVEAVEAESTPVAETIADIPVCKKPVDAESSDLSATEVVSEVKQNGSHTADEDVAAGNGC